MRSLVRSTALTLTVVVPLVASAGWAQATSHPLSGGTRAKVERIIRTFLDTNRTPGVLIGIWSPRGNFVSARGVADLGTGAPLTPDMQFKIGSQTKAFTAVLVLQLVGEKKVSLDDVISKWVAGVPNGDQVTIRQLLNHTSGLANGFPTAQALLPTGCTVAELLAIGAWEPPVAPPGTRSYDFGA